MLFQMVFRVVVEWIVDKIAVPFALIIFPLLVIAFGGWVCSLGRTEAVLSGLFLLLLGVFVMVPYSWKGLRSHYANKKAAEAAKKKVLEEVIRFDK